MIAPLIQGAMFIGIIYWYSKGMMSLINDYYRDEFKTYLENDPKKVVGVTPTKLSGDGEGSCTAVPIEGLPDILKSSNTLTRADGVVTRETDNNADKPIIPLISSKQCQVKSNTAELKDNIADGQETLNDFSEKSAKAIANKQLLNSGKLDYAGTVADSVDEHGSQRADYVGKLILHPVETRKSNYRKIANQQVSDVNNGKLPPGMTTGERNRNGNYFENDGKTSRRKFYGVGGFDVTSASQMAPKIAINGVPISQDLLKQKLEENQRKTCRRKSVNEMIQFWSNYQVQMEIDRTSSPGTQPERTFVMVKLNGDITSPNS